MASAKLALLAFVIVVPLAIVGGVVAAINEGSSRDRLISVGGLSATAIPEFVWAVFFIVVFSLGLGLFPTTAQFPDGASVFTQVKYLLLPSLCLVCVLFGYIARMARAGTIEALEADYTRTAILKGLPQRTVIRRHVLRNSLLPTIAVVATQAGYLIGGLVDHRAPLQLPGDRPDAGPRRHAEGHPRAAERRPADRDRLPRRHADRRHPLLGPEPARPPGGRRMSIPGQPAPAGATEIGTASPAAVGAHGDDARVATKERLALLRRSKSFIAGAIIVGFWVLCAIFGELLVPKDPLASDPINDLLAPSADNWFGTDKLGRDVFSRVIVGARDILIVAPLATILATVVGTALGLVTGYFRGLVDDVLSRIIEAILALPMIIMALLVAVALGPSRTTLIIMIGLLFAPIISRTVRAAVLTEREQEYVAAARLRNERTPYILFGEILPNVMAPIIVEFTVRLGYAIFTAAWLSFLGFGIPPPAPDWGLQVAENYGVISGGFWWPVLFPSLAIATLVIGVNLIADGVASAFER